MEIQWRTQFAWAALMMTQVPVMNIRFSNAIESDATIPPSQRINLHLWRGSVRRLEDKLDSIELVIGLLGGGARKGGIGESVQSALTSIAATDDFKAVHAADTIKAEGGKLTLPGNSLISGTDEVSR
jgi:hypothetical protein